MTVSPRERFGQPDQHQSAAPAVDPFDPGELRLITRRITVRTGAETGLLVVFDEDDRRVDVVASWSAAPTGRGLPLSHLAAGGFIGRVLESGRSAFEPIDPERDSSPGIPGSGGRLTCAAGAGIRPPGGPPGALCLGFSSRPPDTALTMWQIESYARLASLCLEEAGTLDALLAGTRLDGLTGCLNYGAIRAELDREVGRSERHGRPLSCCFIDLDHFKRVNDRHGHLYGNRVLTEVGAALRDGVRVGDSIGRYGGDEFLALLPDADEGAAMALGERLRSKIFAPRSTRTEERLDTSIGVAQWRPGSTADELLGAADAALFFAKDGGGGIVVGAGGLAAVAGHSAAWRRPLAP